MDLPDGLSVAEYEALPEDICRRIEIVDGAIMVNAAPRRLHQDICRRLANALEAACGPALAISTDVDRRLRDIPLLNRRPDAAGRTLSVFCYRLDPTTGTTHQQEFMPGR